MTIAFKLIRNYIRRLCGVASILESYITQLPMASRYTPLKLLVLILMLNVGFVVTSVDADNNRHITKNTINGDKKNSKCWNRTKAFDADGNAQACKAFEQVLNTTCESPDQVNCQWALPHTENRFSKPRWEVLDWRKYWNFIADINKAGVREDLRIGLWERDELNERKEFESGHRRLEVTNIDIDNDGNIEHVVRYDLLPCLKTTGSMFGVLIPESNRLDWRFRYLFLDVNSSEGANIMLYNGRAFMFGWQPGWDKVFIWEGSPGTDSRGRKNICQIKYSKKGAKK